MPEDIDSNGVLGIECLLTYAFVPSQPHQQGRSTARLLLQV